MVLGTDLRSLHASKQGSAELSPASVLACLQNSYKMDSCDSSIASVLLSGHSLEQRRLVSVFLLHSPLVNVIESLRIIVLFQCEMCPKVGQWVPWRLTLHFLGHDLLTSEGSFASWSCTRQAHASILCPDLESAVLQRGPGSPFLCLLTGSAQTISFPSLPSSRLIYLCIYFYIYFTFYILHSQLCQRPMVPPDK